MALIHAAVLENWANTNVARDTLGELLRKLIHAHINLSEIRSIRILAHESNQLSGWDGTLECQSSVPWLPSGTSVWELGTGSNARQKIRTDFSERREKELPSSWDREKTTYVAVTLRKLDDISLLINELKADSPWLDVRIVDAQTLEEWIEISPIVETWLQDQGIGPPSTVRTLSTHWRHWSEKTHPPVSTKLILAGRDSVAADLRRNLDSPGAPINIQADSPGEAVAFVYSVVESSDDILFREHFLARSIVINQGGDSSRFRDVANPQNIILCPPATSEALALARSGHTVVNALGNRSPAQRIDIRIARPLRSEFAAALRAMGMSEEAAGVEARACGGSPSIWRVWNLLKVGDPGDEIPDWAKQECSDLVVPAVLLGGWSENSKGDEEAVKAITGQTFEEYRDKLNPFICTDNPLLVKVGDASVISAPATAFALTLRYITQGHLTRLASVVETVFAEVDPTLELPPEERKYAGIKGMRMQHSTWLRDGLAGSLLRIAVIGQQLERNGVIPGGQNCQPYIDSIIRKLPGLREDWRLLASLKDQLPVLAEAAPIPFMEALESLLQGQPEKLEPIFVEGEGIFDHAFHPGLLWALETLAWEPGYLSRVGIILGRLAEIDPGGRLANRPLNSLREIFLAWHPGTSANLDQRLQALDLLLDRFGEIGWNLLSALLPQNSDSASPTNEPLWRDFGRSQKEALTNRIMWKAYENYVDRAIRHAGMRPERWKTLINICDDVSDECQSGIEKGLTELSKSNLSQDERKMIWENLTHFINRHRAYADASWALTEDRLKRIDVVKQCFNPDSLTDKIAWLFNEDFPDLPIPKRDLHVEQEDLNKMRTDAIKDIWQEGQTELIKDLVNKVSFPGLISSHLLALVNNENLAINVLVETNHGTDKEKFFARCLSASAYNQFGDKWTKLLLSKSTDFGWSPNELANALLYYPDSKQTFDLIKSLDVEVDRVYWTKRSRWVHSKDDDVILHAIKKLKENGRAVDALILAEQKWDSKEPALIFEILDQALEELNVGKGETTFGNDSYWIDRLFRWLRGQEKVDKNELARWEYAYLPLLTGTAEKTDLALHQILSTDPSFFIHVLCDLYKPASSSAEDHEVTADARNRAKFAWKMLNSWKQPPGVGDNRQVDRIKLKEWVEKARKLAAETDRVDIADQEIGKVLFHFPSDPNDSLWPHVDLRWLLEDLESENIERGIELEEANSRGVVTKAMFEGGAQERNLAQKWWTMAEKIGLRWPRTRAMFERLAAYWETSAKHEDDRAEKQRLRST